MKWDFIFWRSGESCCNWNLLLLLKLRSLSGVFLWLYIWHFCYCILSDVDILIYITIGAKALLTFCSTGCCFFVFIFFTILTTVWEFEYSLFDTEYFFLFDWQTLWAFCSHSGVGYVHTHSSYPITPELCHLHKTTIRKIIICEGTQYQQTTQNKILQSNVIYIYIYIVIIIWLQRFKIVFFLFPPHW